MVRLFDNPDRRFCFELVSPSKSFVLQAENEADMRDWMDILNNAIAKALNSNSESSAMQIFKSKEKLDDIEYATPERAEVNSAKIVEIKRMPGNGVCADCTQEAPEWCSINLGVLLCIECSGIHRSLGVHISKVRSLTLDKWDTEMYDVMLGLGN